MQFFAGTQKLSNFIRQTSGEDGKAFLGGLKKQWIIRPANAGAERLAKSLKVSHLLAQVLINRGITDVGTGSVFLRPKLAELIRPELMPGVQAAVRRIKRAVIDRERIAVYGDYDVDGITGVSILWQLLTLLGADVDYYIPHRIEEGYGLNEEAVRYLAQSDSKLLITVDCGISASSSAELAAQLGIELIITDHHQPDERLPVAAAIVHPALDQTYANPDSSGAMVAFKLAWAIANEFNAGRRLEPQLREFMLNATSLAAMGTIADVVDLRGENRILTSYGLQALPQCRLCGVRALIESAGLTGKRLDSFTVGFRLAPMLNAAGRMGHARLAVELLTSNSEIRSMQIADYLKEQNNQRQQIERKIFAAACEMIIALGLNHPDRKSIVLAGEGWHSGVIGIVASRIVDKFCRPTILINCPAPASSFGAVGSEDSMLDTRCSIEAQRNRGTKCGVATGSARSIAGFDMFRAISACSRHLIDFGGHKMAGGITIQTDRIAQFAADFELYAKENLNEDDCIARLDIEAMVRLGEFRKEVVSELQMLGPFGQGNPEPVFVTRGVHLVSPPKRVGARGDHLQLAVSDNTASIRCIGFGMGKLEKKVLDEEFFDVAYQPQLNTYNGCTNVQLVLADMQFESHAPI